MRKKTLKILTVAFIKTLKNSSNCYIYVCLSIYVYIRERLQCKRL